MMDLTIAASRTVQVLRPMSEACGGQECVHCGLIGPGRAYLVRSLAELPAKEGKGVSGVLC
jgi:hypothetical protein